MRALSCSYSRGSAPLPVSNRISSLPVLITVGMLRCSMRCGSMLLSRASACTSAAVALAPYIGCRPSRTALLSKIVATSKPPSLKRKTVACISPCIEAGTDISTIDFGVARFVGSKGALDPLDKRAITLARTGAGS